MKILKTALYSLLLFWPMISRAQIAPPAGPASTVEGLNSFGSQTNLGKQDLITVIAKIVNVILLLLGTVFVVLILIGGFKWMTSGGSSEKIGKAKETITSAAVGLAIVLAAFAISSFVIETIGQAALS